MTWLGLASESLSFSLDTISREHVCLPKKQLSRGVEAYE